MRATGRVALPQCFANSRLHRPCPPPAPQLFDIRAQLQPIAHPPPPAVAQRPALLASHSARKKVRALWSYDGAEEDELTFREGDLIEIVEETSAEWWRGRVTQPASEFGGSSPSQKEGLFPSNYVEAIRPDEASASSAMALPTRRTLPPAFPSPAPPSESGDTLVNEKQNAGGYHGQQGPGMYGGGQQEPQYSSLGPGKWQPGVARWNSGGPPPPPPVPPPPGNGNAGYYNQPPMPYGPNTPAAYGQQQPIVMTEEQKKKQDKVRSCSRHIFECARYADRYFGLSAVQEICRANGPDDGGRLCRRCRFRYWQSLVLRPRISPLLSLQNYTSAFPDLLTACVRLQQLCIILSLLNCKCFSVAVKANHGSTQLQRRSRDVVLRLTSYSRS